MPKQLEGNDLSENFMFIFHCCLLKRPRDCIFEKICTYFLSNQSIKTYSERSVKLDLFEVRCHNVEIFPNWDDSGSFKEKVCELQRWYDKRNPIHSGLFGGSCIDKIHCRSQDSYLAHFCQRWRDLRNGYRGKDATQTDWGFIPAPVNNHHKMV